MNTESLNHLSDSEILDLLEENYFTLATTGAQAVQIVAEEIADGAYHQHDLSDERMTVILGKFAMRVLHSWDTHAMNTNPVA